MVLYPPRGGLQARRGPKETFAWPAKASSVVYTAATTPKAGSVKEEPSPSEERPTEVPHAKPSARAKSDSPERARSSGQRRRIRRSSSRRPRNRSEKREERKKDSREREEREGDRRGKEKKRRERESSEERRREVSRSPIRPAEPRGPPPSRREEPYWRSKGKGKGRHYGSSFKYTNKGRGKRERQAVRRGEIP